MPRGFIPNRSFPAEMEREPSYQQGLAAAAQPAVDHAKNLAPVDEGDYRDGIKVKIVQGRVYVAGTDFKSHWIEYGTVDTPVFAPLRRGVRAAGLRFTEN